MTSALNQSAIKSASENIFSNASRHEAYDEEEALELPPGARTAGEAHEYERAAAREQDDRGDLHTAFSHGALAAHITHYFIQGALF